MELYDKLKEYFDKTPKEQVLKDWNKTKIFDKVDSPTIKEFGLHIVNRSTKKSTKKIIEVINSDNKAIGSVTSCIDKKGNWILKQKVQDITKE